MIRKSLSLGVDFLSTIAYLLLKPGREIGDISKLMRKLKSEDRTLALGIVAVLGILLIFNFIFLRPRIRRLRQLNPELMTLIKNVRETTKDAANIDILKKRQEDLKTKVNFYTQKLPRGKEISALLESLSRVAKESQIKIIEIKPRDRDIRSKGEMYLEVPIAVKASGGYHQLGKFINKLEGGLRFIRISDIAIKENPRNSKDHNIRLLLSMFVLVE